LGCDFIGRWQLGSGLWLWSEQNAQITVLISQLFNFLINHEQRSGLSTWLADILNDVLPSERFWALLIILIFNQLGTEVCYLPCSLVHFIICFISYPTDLSSLQATQAWPRFSYLLPTSWLNRPEPIQFTTCCRWLCAWAWPFYSLWLRLQMLVILWNYA
jgi:hypothetical protein